ncbi:MAG: multidrug transporter [Lachnospiraceae bacterium]|nr:multidrug transporter [Lachnospiraceae bacterium]
MVQQGFTKNDWTLFRSKLPGWQEAFMDKLNKEYIALLSKDANPSDRFWELDRRIRNDRQKAGVQLRMSRSNFIPNILSLLHEGAIGLEDLDEFSEELRDTIRIFTRQSLEEADY